MGGRRGRATLVALLATVCCLTCATARAADPAAGLSAAESRAASAETEVVAAQRQVAEARTELAAAQRRAAGPAREAREAGDAARDLRGELTARQRGAKGRIATLDERHRQEEEDRDREVRLGIGTGLAALVGIGFAVGWGRFRGSGPVATLAGMERAQALGLCLGGGFLLIVTGAALSEVEGFVGGLGAFLLGIGFVLPTAFLLARQAVRVADGRAKPVLGRDRLPEWAPWSAAAALAILALVGFVVALAAESPPDDYVSDQLRAEAAALTEGADARRLEAAEADAEAARERASGPLAELSRARGALLRVKGEEEAAVDRLVAAEADEARFSRRLAALREREEREAAREAEEAQVAAEEAADEESSASGCDSNYSPCVPPYPPDVNCDEVAGPVTVTGSDPHGLDADGDGIGCE